MPAHELVERLTLPRPFRPHPIDQRAARRRVDAAVRGLLPGAVDEATGHAQDNLINAMAVGWASGVKQQFFEYATRADHRIGRADAKRVRPQRRHQHRMRHLKEMADARDAALALLRGTTPEPRTDKVTAGYADPSLVAGRHAGWRVHLFVFVLAAVADMAALWGVMQLLMRASGPLMSWLVVTGLTVSVLYLAHIVGALLRDQAAAVPWVRPAKAWLCALVWALIGACCFWVRLVVTPETSGRDRGFSVAAGSAARTPPEDLALENALIFLALYVGAGVVAMVGAYVTRNPLAAAYRTACRAHRLAAFWARRSAVALRKADTRVRTQLAVKADAERVLAHRIHDCWTFATELKQHARLVLAHGAQDPAFTDAVVDQDWLTHPLWPIAGELPSTDVHDSTREQETR